MIARPRSLPALLAPAALAIAASLAFAVPAAALDGESALEPELAQAVPPPPPPAAMPETRPRMPMNPKAMCLDRLARRIGNRTYLRIRLDLKPEQMAAWEAFAKAAEGADAKETAACNALPSEMKERPTMIDRMTMRETFMKTRLERIEAVKPSMTALYNALSPEQKTVLDGPMSGMMGGGMGGMGHGMHGPR